MTVSCDKKGCDKKSTDNYRMYSFQLEGTTPNKYSPPDKDSDYLELHFCFEHRKEIAKIFNKWRESKIGVKE